MNNQTNILKTPQSYENEEKLSAALAHLYSLGATHIPSTRESGHVVHVPFSLSPRILSRECFVRAMDLAKPFNILVDRVARNPDWLLKTLKAAGEADKDFTGKLLDVFEHAIEDGMQSRKGAKRGEMRQQYMLGIHRSDYMIDDRTSRLLQIELNTISSSFGCLSTQVHNALHCINDRYGDHSEKKVEIQISDSLNRIPEALRTAHEWYVKNMLMKPIQFSPIVLFVVQEGERNIMDQRLIEFNLLKHSIHCVRATLFEISQYAKQGKGVSQTTDGVGESNSGSNEDKEGVLYYNGREVSVVYFRAGYTPNDYLKHTEEEWAARDVIECSNAIKCPSIGYHLAGSKKAQQALAAPGVLEEFLKDRPTDVDILRSCFAGLWSLDDDVNVNIDDGKNVGKGNTEAGGEKHFNEGYAKVIADAIEHPERYVLKPQREGGGNNVYGKALSDMLRTQGRDILAAYILMERIFPREERAVLVRSGKAEILDKTVSELGVYSVFFGNGSGNDGTDHSNVILNEAGGYLLRTKPSDSDEGGVAAGYAVLDSVAFVEEEK
jgi:glutathione synthase